MTVGGTLPIRVLLVSLQVLFLFSAFLVLYIIAHRFWSDRRQAWFDLHYRRIAQELLDMLTSQDPEAPVRLGSRNRRFREPLTQALLDIARLVKGPERRLLARVFSLALQERTLKDLRSPFLIRRLTAARLLEFFGELPGRATLERLLKDKPPVRLAAVSALARIQSGAAVRAVLDAMESEAAPNFQDYMEILFPLGEALEGELRERLKRALPAETLAFYIELAGHVPLRRLYPEIAGFASSPDKELRIRAARALARLELPESLPVIRELAGDPEWEVQAQALLGLGRLKDRGALQVLAGALRSRHWFVRLNAKEALIMMGEPGFACLRETALKSEDRFAADMARMGLREYGLEAD
jgi:hypothetical protein